MLDKPLVLIVEKECQAVTDLREKLKAQYEFAHATTLKDALVLLDKITPDVILLDLCLPDSTEGLTFHAIHRKMPTVPIVVCLANENEHCDVKSFASIPKETIDLMHIDQILKQAVITHRITAIYMPLDKAVDKIGKTVKSLTDSQVLLREERDRLIQEARRNL